MSGHDTSDIGLAELQQARILRYEETSDAHDRRTYQTAGFGSMSPSESKSTTPFDSKATSARNSSDGLPFSSSSMEQPVQLPTEAMFQARPAQLKNMTAEILFVMTCALSQILFSFLLGNVATLQDVLVDKLNIPHSQSPWLIGSYALANGLSVIVSGPVADLTKPKYLICGAFAWLTAWSVVGCFSLTNKYLFFVVRACQGIAVGVLLTSTLCICGRIYKPGLRKTRIFSAMASGAPLGFWLGCISSSALATADVRYIYVLDAAISACCLAAALYAIPAIDSSTVVNAPFDYLGSVFAVTGCSLLVAGLTQGPSVSWAAYAIAIVVIGVAFIVAFFFIETRAKRPIMPPQVWKAPSFTPLAIAYFVGFGGYMSWQWYMVQFFLHVQHASPVTTALYILPNPIIGVLAAYIVSIILHRVPGHYVFFISMVCFGLGPVFFLPQTAGTPYWNLSLVGISLVTLGPDLSFAAASVIITSSTPKSYQGSAASILVTLQNLSAAIMTSISDSIGVKVTDGSGSTTIDLSGLRAIWYFNMACAIVAAAIVLIAVRVPKSIEKDHEKEY